jgi:hypothetical protein
MPLASQVAASSSSIVLEASEMSVWPSQNSSKPSPVPGPSTAMSTLLFSPVKASAASDVIGSTVDDPEMLIEPETSPPPLLRRRRHRRRRRLQPG